MSIKYPIICKKQDQIQMRFQVWYHCAKEAGHLYKSEWYLGKNKSAEKNWRPGVVLEMTKSV